MCATKISWCIMFLVITMATKTNAMRLLDKLKVAYDVIEYPCKEALDGIEVAKKLNADVNCVFKTLVTIAPSKNHYVFILPANKELDLKLCAKAVNEKSIEMIPMKALLPTTGYVRGGCSPFAMKKAFPTIIDQSIEEVEKVYVSGGKLGLQLHIASNDLIHSTNALVTKITRD